MNTPDIQFLRHKITSRKYIRFASGPAFPVSDLPHLAENDGAMRVIKWLNSLGSEELASEALPVADEPEDDSSEVDPCGDSFRAEGLA